jgi:uncharacterized membrane protein
MSPQIKMDQIKPTRVGYTIAAIGIVPIAVVSIWQPEIAAWINVTPKLVSAAGVALCVLTVLSLTLLLKRDRERYRVRSEHRTFGFALLCVGVTYFWTREEIAELVGWQIRVGDG